MSVSPFTSAHRLYVKSLYKRMLKLEQDWAIQYTLFRPRALAIRAQFEANRSVDCIFSCVFVGLLYGRDRTLDGEGRSKAVELGIGLVHDHGRRER